MLPSLVRHLALMALVLTACRQRIGDDCRQSTDCSIRQERACDLSLPGGYCTIEGCNFGSCPKESLCVKTYGSDFLTMPCDPQREDLSDGTNDCLRHEVCLGEGVCADEVAARSTCRKRCKRNSDCREGYECRATGKRGVYVAANPEDPLADVENKICLPP